MTYLGIDPGTRQTAWALYTDYPVNIQAGIESNVEFLRILQDRLAPIAPGPMWAIEGIASYGMPVGREIFETAYFIGRVQESTWRIKGMLPRIVYRKEVKIHLCGSMKAKDTNIRQALIDKFGPIGVKKAPGILYGLRADMFSALAIAVTAAETPWLQNAE